MNNYFVLFPVFCLVIIFWLEGVFPQKIHQSNRIHHAITNTVIALLAGMITFSFTFLITQRATNWHQIHSFGVLNRLELPGILKIALAILFFDFWMYLWHRFNHRIQALWLLHRAHHNDINMDVTTALRFHPIEILLSCILNVGIVIMLGMTLSQFLAYNILLQVIIFFHHSNVRIPESWDQKLRSIIVTPNMHRVHHSIENTETNSNYSSVFSFWDKIFKTFKKREDVASILYGLDIFREHQWQSLKGFLKIPFKKISSH